MLWCFERVSWMSHVCLGKCFCLWIFSHLVALFYYEPAVSDTHARTPTCTHIEIFIVKLHTLHTCHSLYGVRTHFPPLSLRYGLVKFQKMNSSSGIKYSWIHRECMVDNLLTPNFWSEREVCSQVLPRARTHAYILREREMEVGWHCVEFSTMVASNSNFLIFSYDSTAHYHLHVLRCKHIKKSRDLEFVYSIFLGFKH